MCTGERPFRRKSTTALLHAILHDAPPAPSKSHPELPRALDNIIARLLEKDTAARYADAHDVLADLARASTITPSTVPA
jgi:eukaryotic-like serine/threonine-protein kinase